jgi:hypothetical protein
MFILKNKKIILSIMICGFLFLIVSNASAQGYTPLAPIPGFVDDNLPTNNLNKYLNDMFRLGIAIAIALAVIMIIVGGIQYMSTDAIGKMNEGKKSIQAALTGLLVALAAYMIIKTLDPNMLSTRLGLDRDLSSLTGRILVPEEIGQVIRPGHPNYPFQQNDPRYGQPVTRPIGVLPRDPDETGQPRTGNNIDPNQPTTPPPAGQYTPPDKNAGNTVGRRNNNPGNVKKPGPEDWCGTRGYDSQGHAIFDTQENGIRAHMRMLTNQYTGRASNNFKTINQLLSYYTHVAGDRREYADYIRRHAGIDPNSDINLMGPDGKPRKEVLYPLSRAMYDFENGGNMGISNQALDSAYRKAFEQDGCN